MRETISRQFTQNPHARRNLVCLAAQAIAVAVLMIAAGCATSAKPSNISAEDSAAQVMTINAGDQLAIDFFGAPELNSAQTVRVDGKISLKLVGDVMAAGKTPDELQTALVELYASQLQSKSITVTLVSGTPIYVSGAVPRPGKFVLQRPTTAIEAIMEAGGFIPGQADSHAVTVIRHENGARRGFVLDYSDALMGKSGSAFYLRAGDIVYVPGATPWIQKGRP